MSSLDEISVPRWHAVQVHRAHRDVLHVYSPLHIVVSTVTTAFNNQICHSCLLHTPGGSPSTYHQPFSSQQHPGSLNHHLSEPNIRLAMAQPPHFSLSNVPEMCYQHEEQLPQCHHSFQHSTTPILPTPSSALVSADRRPSMANSAVSSGWESIHAELLQEIASVI
jgi:hypothetical protein